MYCKFCGNTLEEGAVRCSQCNAPIFLRDGGQSFFSEDELTAWQASPKMNPTRMIEPQEYGTSPKTKPTASRKNEAFFTPKMIAFTVIVLVIAVTVLSITVLRLSINHNKKNSEVSTEAREQRERIKIQIVFDGKNDNIEALDTGESCIILLDDLWETLEITKQENKDIWKSKLREITCHYDENTKELKIKMIPSGKEENKKEITVSKEDLVWENDYYYIKEERMKTLLKDMGYNVTEEENQIKITDEIKNKALNEVFK